MPNEMSGNVAEIETLVHGARNDALHQGGKKDKFPSISISRAFCKWSHSTFGLLRFCNAKRKGGGDGIKRERGIFLQVTERANFSFAEIQLGKNGIRAICHGPPLAGLPSALKWQDKFYDTSLRVLFAK